MSRVACYCRCNAECECHDHADSCTFNTELGHAVCDSCQHNTAGGQCEQCAEGFFRNTSASLNDSDVCLRQQHYFVIFSVVAMANCSCHLLMQGRIGLTLPRSDDSALGPYRELFKVLAGNINKYLFIQNIATE